VNVSMAIRSSLIVAVASVAGVSSLVRAEEPSALDERCRTAQCVEDLATERCYSRAASLEGCREFIRSLQSSANRSRREYRLTYAASSGALAGRVVDDAEREKLQLEERNTYEKLVQENPKDAQALMGLAAIARDRPERIALLKRVAEADPTDTIALRTLAAHLAEGTPEEQAQGLEYMRRAYQGARAPHRWHLAEMYHQQLIDAARHGDASQLAESVLAEMGSDAAKERIASALQRAKAVSDDSLFSALGKVCNQNALYFGTASICMDSVVRIARVASASPGAVSDANIEALATAAMTLSRELGGDAQANSRRELRESLEGLIKARKDSSVLLRAQALLVSMERDLGARRNATELLERAVVVSPGDGDARLALGRAYLEQERFRQAIVQFEEAVRALPDYKRGAARTYLALALERDGQFERAARVRSELSAQ